jgi:predicted helicase
MTALTFSQMIEVKNRIQKEACEAVVKEFNLCKKEGLRMKAILNLATGAGKTRTAHTLVFKHMNSVNTILFMVPKISLVDQTIAEWKALDFDFEYATAYSHGDLKTVQDIQYFMSKESSVKKVVFAVYNSVGINNERGESNLTRSDVSFDLAIYDECHNVGGKEFGLFTSCADDLIVKADRKLFMTATVKEYEDTEEDEFGLGGENNNQFSMANSDIFGNVAYSLTIFEAIRLGILCNFQTYLLQVSDERIKRMLNKDMEFLGDIVKGRHLATAYSVIKAYNMGARKIVVMYQQRSDAHDFNRLFRFMQNELNVLQGATIGCVASDTTPTQLGAPRSYADANGETVVIKSNDNRKAQQWWLKYGPFCNSETAIATSSPWLKEGEDIPCIDCIVFGDRFQSGIDIVQIIGRALRYTETKQIAHIILPIMEGEANEAARIIRSTIGNMQSEINEVQIIRAAAPKSSSIEVSETEERTSNETEERTERWVFDNDSTTTSTLEVNQGEMTVEVIHDSTFTESAREQHNKMLQVVGLKLSNKYKQSLIDEKAERFINQIIAEVEDYNNGSVSQKTSLRRYQTDNYYFEKYASYYNLTMEESIKQLDEKLEKIRQIRKNMLLGFFNVK